MTRFPDDNPVERQTIANGKAEFPRDVSGHFVELCDACRRGDLEAVQTLVSNFGVDINRTDAFDASPLMLASLCGHAEIVQYLLDSGAILDRHSFQGERCLYGALNDTIRLMLLRFDISKAVDPTQPFASFLMSLLNPVDTPATTDIVFRLEPSEDSHGGAFALHRFILAARSEDLRKNLESHWIGKCSVKMPSEVHPRSMESIVKYLYSGEATDPGHECRDNLKFVAETLHMPAEMMELVSATGVPPTAAIRDLKRIEINRVQSDFEKFVHHEIIGKQRTVKTEDLENTRKEMSASNPVWADCLLYLDREDGTMTLFYAHIAILTRSEYFLTMFTSPFAESRTLFEHQETLPLMQLDVDTDVAHIILTFLYTDRAEIPRDNALEVLCAAAFLLLPRLKSLAAIALENESDPLNEFGPADLYEILRAAWLTNTERLEQFCAKNLAKHLDVILKDPEFHLLVKESASRISNRQETDTIELIDDIRFYLSQLYGILQEDVDRSTGRIDESERPTTIYEREYNQKLLYHAFIPLGPDSRLIDELLERLDLDA